MHVEFERKFLVKPGLLLEPSRSYQIIQGYLSFDPKIRVRMVILDNGEVQGILTVSLESDGIKKTQLETRLPFSEQELRFLLRYCKGYVISKRRHEIEWQGKKWEIDVFEELNAGLIVAEIELASENEKFELPPWVSCEVTGDERYKNHRLAQTPYKNWRIS